MGDFSRSFFDFRKYGDNFFSSPPYAFFLFLFSAHKNIKRCNMEKEKNKNKKRGGMALIIMFKYYLKLWRNLIQHELKT